MSGSFQTHTNQMQAPGIAGDFASANPRFSALSTQYYNQTGFQAGPLGLTVGRFAWLDKSTYSIASNFGSGVPNAFASRCDMNGLITQYLNAYTMTIPAGFPAGNLFDGGDFWIVNSGTTEAVPGMKAYADNTTGLATFALTGAPTTGGSGDASSIAAGTASVTGSITNNILTVTAGSGLKIGGILSGTGVATGTQLINQLTGTAGAAGTYTVTPREQTVASTTISETFGTLTVGGTVTGTFAVGQTVSGSGGGGVTAGTNITALGTGVGGAGTYIVNLTQTVTSSTIISTTNTETGWYCRGFALQGEVVKISSRSNG